MADGKKKILVICGGRSAEHEISLLSASSVLQNLDRKKYSVRAAAITRGGEIYLHPVEDFSPAALARTANADGAGLLYLIPGRKSGSFVAEAGPVVETDLLFPVLHGTYGEDGTIQGMFEILGLPYVGCGVLASALAMDKGLAKIVLQQAGLPVLPGAVFSSEEWRGGRETVLKNCMIGLRYPIFVKPCNLGSSIGVTKVEKENQLAAAIDEAFTFDTRVLVEQGIDAREIEMSVLGNQQPRASLPGEVIPKREFYDYAAKYIDDNSRLEIPAKLPEALIKDMQKLAVQAYWALCGEGMGRIDFLLDRQSLKPYISEINAIPGFTAISMYPKMWEASGLSYQDLLTELVELALARFAERSRLKIDYDGKKPV